MEKPDFGNLDKRKAAGVLAIIATVGLAIAAIHGMDRAVILAEEGTRDDIAAIPECTEETAQESDAIRKGIIALIRERAPEGRYKDDAVSVVDFLGSAASLPGAAEGVADLVDVFDYFEANQAGLRDLSLMKPHEAVERLDEANHQLRKAVGALEAMKKTGLCFSPNYLGEYTRRLDKIVADFDTNGIYQLIASEEIDGNPAAKIARIPFDLLGSYYKYRRELEELEFNVRTLAYMLHSLQNSELETPSNNDALNALLEGDDITEDKLHALRDGIRSVFQTVKKSSGGKKKKKRWRDRAADTVKGWLK